VISATAIGNLVRDPETRQTQGGSVTNVTVAVNRKRGGEESATFIRCAIWGKRGEAFAQYHSKGDKAALTGELYARKYTANDGAERESWEMDVQNFAFVGSGGGGGQAQPQRGYQNREQMPLPQNGPPSKAFAPQHDDLPF
jgi:single-strand DNA-binding protein